MTPNRSTVAILALALFSTSAYAEGGENAAEQVDAPKPRIISSGQDERGTHAFLAVTPKGPMVFHGDEKELKELDVLSMVRVRGGFVVDTLERGELTFQTGQAGESRVIQPGIPGFNSPRPTVVMGAKAKPALIDQVMERIGGAAPKTSGVAVELPAGNGAVRFPAARLGQPVKVQGPVAHATLTSMRLKARRMIKARTRLAPRAHR